MKRNPRGAGATAGRAAQRCVLAGAACVMFSLSSAVGDQPKDRAGSPAPQVRAPGQWSFGTSSGETFCDDFDAYPPGEVCGQGGWEEWTGSVGVCGSVTTEQANSPPHSLKIVGVGTPPGDDTVQQLDIVGGVWTFRTMTYVPTDATGTGSAILLNTYPTIANSSWSMVIWLDATQNQIRDWNNVDLTPMIKGQWVELRAEIDIPNDSYDVYYDGKPFVTGSSWRDHIQPGGTGRIRAIDLYGGEPGSGGITAMYFDDIGVFPEGGGCGCDPCDTNCDGTIDAFDIEPFIDVLLGGPGCSSCSGDTDGSGTVDAFDIEPFINCLVGP